MIGNAILHITKFLDLGWSDHIVEMLCHKPLWFSFQKLLVDNYIHSSLLLKKERRKGMPSDLVLHFWTLSTSLHWGTFVLGSALSTLCFAGLIPFIRIYYFLALATFEFEPPMYTVIKGLYITRGHHPLLGFYWAFTRLEVDELGTTGPGY